MWTLHAEEQYAAHEISFCVISGLGNFALSVILVHPWGLDDESRLCHGVECLSAGGKVSLLLEREHWDFQVADAVYLTRATLWAWVGFDLLWRGLTQQTVSMHRVVLFTQWQVLTGESAEKLCCCQFSLREHRKLQLANSFSYTHVLIDRLIELLIYSCTLIKIWILLVLTTSMLASLLAFGRRMKSWLLKCFFTYSM